VSKKRIVTKVDSSIGIKKLRDASYIHIPDSRGER